MMFVALSLPGLLLLIATVLLAISWFIVLRQRDRSRSAHATEVAELRRKVTAQRVQLREQGRALTRMSRKLSGLRTEVECNRIHAKMSAFGARHASQRAAWWSAIAFGLQKQRDAAEAEVESARQIARPWPTRGVAQALLLLVALVFTLGCDSRGYIPTEAGIPIVESGRRVT